MHLFLKEYEEVLREASSVGDVATVAKLVEKRYVKDVDAPNGLGWTALHLAAVCIPRSNLFLDVFGCWWHNKL